MRKHVMVQININDKLESMGGGRIVHKHLLIKKPGINSGHFKPQKIGMEPSHLSYFH